MNFAVIVFPGSNCDHDCHHAVTTVLGQTTTFVWHKEKDLGGAEAVIIPGGFSYGDYLRAGAISRFSPIMKAVASQAAAGRPVIGICNGFQVLCEAGLLPGVLRRNNHLQFRCQWTNLRVENVSSPFTSGTTIGQVLRVPISHGEGNYFANRATLDQLEELGQIIFRYSTEDGDITGEANPNGSVGNIAGISNVAGNVLGMMPHPERCCESLLGGEDGLYIFQSLISQFP